MALPIHKHKVVFLTHTLYPDTNAAASRVYERLKYFNEAGLDCLVVSQYPQNSAEKEGFDVETRWRNIEVKRLWRLRLPGSGLISRALRFIWFSFTSFFVLLFKVKTGDIIFASSPQYLTLEVARLVSYLKRAKLIVEIADLWPDTIADLKVLKRDSWLFRVWKKSELSIYRASNAVIALTPGIKGSIVQMQPELKAKTFVIPNGFDETRWRPVTVAPQKDSFVVGYYGAIGRAQSIETLVEAALIVNNKSSVDVKFVVGGLGERWNAIQDLIIKLGLQNFKILPAQPKRKMRDAWSNIDLCVVPLKNIELFKGSIPTKITECFGMEIPIILSSPYSDAAKIIEREGFGLVVSPENPNDVADAILALSESPNKMIEFRRNLKTKKNNFTRKVQAEKILDLILKVERSSQ